MQFTAGSRRTAGKMTRRSQSALRQLAPRQSWSWTSLRPTPPVALRWLVVGAQVATIVITWPLWQARHAPSPPCLPALPLPQVDLAWPIILSALSVLAVPRWGWLAHASVILVAMLLDQTRIQPQIVSHLLLLLGTLAAGPTRLVGQLHLISLWTFSGVHKLISPGFYREVAPWLWQHLFPSLAAGGAVPFGIALGVAELSLGVLAIVPRTRRLAAIAAVPFHLGIFLSLSPWGIDWNEAVWPWNIALAGAGWGLLYDWPGGVAHDLARVARHARVVAAIVLLAPAGYYLGVVDAYLAHCLYAGNTMRGTWYHQGERQNLSMATIDELHVPLPPTERTYWALFMAWGSPGDQLVIEDPRLGASWRGHARRVWDYPNTQRPAP